MREIERMSIAEMEAEAGKVQEEIKRRKASRLPLVLMLFCLSS
jgi:hypothetical protein